MLRAQSAAHTPVQPAPQPPPLDFALLQQSTAGQTLRSRRALLWLLGLLVLALALVISLVLYLHAFEQEEEEHRRVADGQWLEQSVRFHFNRLEEDLLVLARSALRDDGQPARPGAASGPVLERGGLLWNEPGAVLWHGWQGPRAGGQPAGSLPPRWRADAERHPANADALSSMLDIAAGLRRSAYGGPMRAADGSATDVVWLTVPFFERGAFAGNYVAALSMDACVQGLVPPWFQDNHRVRLVTDSARTGRDGAGGHTLAYLAPMGLPGTDLFIEVATLDTQPAMVPRIFLLVALLFLLGMLVSLVALRRDIRKRQRVQSLLQAQVALRTAMENSVTVGLRAWARDGRILYVNEAFCRMVGYRPHELIGKTAPLPYWPDAHTPALHAMHEGVISQGTQQEGIEVQFQHRDGHPVDVLIHEAPLVLDDREHIGWMSSVLDISERKRAMRLAAVQQEKLEASGRLVAMGEVASTLAHELNQPLGALSSFAHGLLNRLRRHNIAPDEVERVVERMAGLSDKAGSVIRRVNAFARKRALSQQPIDLVPFVRRCAAQQASQRLGPRLTLPAPSDMDQVVVLADDTLLEHVVSNLVSNALIWALPPEADPDLPDSPVPATGPGEVRVSVHADAARGMGAIAVSDSGPGVPEPDREHIFTAFFSTTDSGMGMGLAICRSIVEAHHGRIEVSRDPLLGGARFTVWLPLASAPVPHPAEVMS